MAIVEALACGTPVAGTPAGGTPEILRRIDSQLVFSKTTAEAIAAGLELLLREPNRLPELSDRARELAARCYDWECVIDQLEELLRATEQRTLPRG